MPSSTSGRSSNQVLLEQAISAALSRRWSFHQSISAGMVSCCVCAVDAQESHELRQQTRLKLAATVRCKGGRYSKTDNPDRKAWVTASVVMLVRVMASGQRVKLSTHVSKYV